jgi:hypothetical protein
VVALVERVQKAEGYFVLPTLLLTSEQQRDEHALIDFRFSLTGYAVSQNEALNRLFDNPAAVLQPICKEDAGVLDRGAGW